MIDLEAENSYTDLVVIATTYNERQTRAVADGIQSHLRNNHQVRSIGREDAPGWVLLDYGDVVVHVFHEDTRAIYNLDELWKDAPRLPVPTTDEDGSTQAAAS